MMLHLSGKHGKRVYMVGFMAGVTAVTIGIVSILHGVAAPVVERNSRLYAMRAVLGAAGEDVPDDPASLYKIYTRRVKRMEMENLPAGVEELFLYEPDKPEESGGKWIFKARGKGLWGVIEAMVGVNGNGAFSGIAFLEHNETPGLGARMEENWFVRQFRGKSGPVRFFSEDAGDLDNHGLNGITGATITTAAIESMANAVWRASEALADKSPGAEEPFSTGGEGDE